MLKIWEIFFIFLSYPLPHPPYYWSSLFQYFDLPYLPSCPHDLLASHKIRATPKRGQCFSQEWPLLRPYF